MNPENSKRLKRLAGSAGGIASAKKLTKKQRTDRARNAGLAAQRKRRLATNKKGA